MDLTLCWASHAFACCVFVPLAMVFGKKKEKRVKRVADIESGISVSESCNQNSSIHFRESLALGAELLAPRDSTH